MKNRLGLRAGFLFGPARVVGDLWSVAGDLYVVMQEGISARVENPEELVPGNILDSAFRPAEINTDQATFHPGGMAAAGFDPFPDFIVICHCGCAHHRLHPDGLYFQPEITP
jgi:hypothetical protein